MDLLVLSVPALGYVLLQAVALSRLHGFWRTAALGSAVGLGVLMVMSVAGGLLGWRDADIGVRLAVPVGLVWLVAVLALSVAVQAVGRRA